MTPQTKPTPCLCVALIIVFLCSDNCISLFRWLYFSLSAFYLCGFHNWTSLSFVIYFTLFHSTIRRGGEGNARFANGSMAPTAELAWWRQSRLFPGWLISEERGADWWWCTFWWWCKFWFTNQCHMFCQSVRPYRHCPWIDWQACSIWLPRRAG